MDRDRLAGTGRHLSDHNDAVASKLPITVLVQTKNEAFGIQKCLSSLADFDEVIVVDSDSDDATKDLAVASGATVVNFTWNGKYPKKKQWELDNVKTRNRWILFLDADESPNAELITALMRERPELERATHAAYDIRLDYVFAGRALKHGHRVVKRALVRADSVFFPVMDDLDAPGMGELEGHYQPQVRGSVGQLHGRITHDDVDPVRTWFDRHNKYSDWEAFLRVRSAAKSAVSSRRSRQGQLFDRVPFKPIVFFTYSYVARRGFQDGRAGLDYAVALSTYYWQIGLKTRELRRHMNNTGAAGRNTPR